MPTFPGWSVVVEVVEEMPPGTPVSHPLLHAMACCDTHTLGLPQILEYSALDGDAGVNGSLTYRIVSSLPENHFIINCEF